MQLLRAKQKIKNKIIIIQLVCLSNPAEESYKQKQIENKLAMNTRTQQQKGSHPQFTT